MAETQTKTTPAGAARIAIEKELLQLRQLNQEANAKISSLESEAVMLRAKAETAESQRDGAFKMQEQMAAEMTRDQTLDDMARGETMEYPYVPLIQEYNSLGVATVSEWGRVLVSEEKDHEGNVITPGIFAFRRRLAFKEDSSYSISAIQGRAASAITLFLANEFTGPIDTKTQNPTFRAFPPFSQSRTLDILLVIR